MAPKQPEKIENPHAGSSSEEDEEESGSTVEESESSGEDSKKDESSDDEGETLSKLTQKTIAAPVAAKKPESDSEGSESESDSDPEPVEKKTKPLSSVGTKAKPETSGSAAVTLPESSTAKRSLKQTEDEAAKKKMKTSNTEHVKKPAATDEEVKKISGDEAKKMFQRLFSETDEIAMLQGYLDFSSTRGDPAENMDAFCDYVKTLIDFNATKSQITTKLQRCKKKFVNMVKNSLKKGKTEDKIKFSKDLDQKAFDLSRKIWGADGVLPAKPRKKSKEVKLPHATPSSHAPRREEEMEIPKAIVVNTHLFSSSSREIASFYKAENLSGFSLDESTITAGWDMVADGPKKREMEEKLKKVKATQVELCLQRSGLVDSTARMIFKENASS